MPYGVRLLECLLEAGARVYLLYSQAAQIVAQQEMDLTFPGRAREVEQFFAERFKTHNDQLRVFGREDWFAPVASGSNPADAMVICPCSMGTLAAVACGLADNLIERAADVMLKERRPLVSGAARNAVVRDSSREHAAPCACRGGDSARQSRLLSSSQHRARPGRFRRSPRARPACASRTH